MSDKTNGATGERDNLMLELLGTIVERFDKVEDVMDALLKVQKQTAAKKPVERDTEAEIKAIRQTVTQAAADGTVAAFKAREPALAKSVSSSVQDALLGNRQDTRLLGEAAENMLHLIRKWALFATLGSFLIGASIAALIGMWINPADNTRTFEEDIASRASFRSACLSVDGSVDKNEDDTFCIIMRPRQVE